jgi:hypothetical protein|nr:MAG TPA: hypothetical protein [Caudoviricetes sp.]
MKLMNILRKNIGTIIASFGLVLLAILTFGDLGEIMTEQYWQNVKDNLTSISFMSIALTMIQVSIKQGVSEQALQRGLNTENTAKKYQEHRDLVKSANDRIMYMPYFLQTYNRRHTALKKQEFLVNNNFHSEKALYQSENRRLIRKYEKIRVFLTVNRIKWATTEVIYNKKGQILTLAEHRAKRTMNGIVKALFFMIGITFLTRGLFFTPSGEPLWQKFVKLLSYIIVMAMTSVLAIIKEYEKGAFGVPNELDEINEIWREFKNWETPEWVVKEVEEFNSSKEVEDEREESKTASDGGTDVQSKQEKVKDIPKAEPDNVLVFHGPDDNLCHTNEQK